MHLYSIFYKYVFSKFAYLHAYFFTTLDGFELKFTGTSMTFAKNVTLDCQFKGTRGYYESYFCHPFLLQLM